MKLFFFIDNCQTGGKERRCLQLIKGLNNRGYNDIHLILFDNSVGYKDTLRSLNVSIHILDRKSPRDIAVFFKLVKLIRKAKPDIVLSWSIMSSFWLNFIRLFIKFNYISAYVADITPIQGFISKISAKLSIVLCKYIIGNSQAGLQAYNIPSEKQKLIYNGFDFERLDKIEASEIVRQKFSITTKYVVTMVARVMKPKDYQTFIDAAKMLLSARNDITFLCVGAGILMEFYKKQLSEEESKLIRFLGSVNCVEDIINITNICVLCTYDEGISNFILESMAIGKPVIATNVGGTPEIVQDKITGYLISQENQEELIFYITSLLNDENLCNQMGNALKETVKDKFALDRMCDEFMEIFNASIIIKHSY
ncbi:glycosyl transferase group 1 [Bacteroidia bacterium]|nr:glycosyl transferase group 1 [Bacteroidia bacterium]